MSEQVFFLKIKMSQSGDFINLFFTSLMAGGDTGDPQLMEI